MKLMTIFLANLLFGLILNKILQKS